MSEKLIILGRAWALSLYEASFQIAVLVAAVGLVSFLLRRSSPAVRYGLWCIVLVRLCIPTGLSVSDFTGRPAPGERPPVSVRQGPKERPSREEIDSWREQVMRVRRNLTVTGIGWGAICVGLLALVGGRALHLHRRVHRLPLVSDARIDALMQECRREIGLRRRVQVRCAPDADYTAPAVTAVLAPVVILPETMVRSWEPSDLKPILLHELAHVRRFDVAVNWLQIVLQCIYFFHPLVWFANWQIRSLREEACDDLSIAHLGGKRSRYSSSLLRAVELARCSTPACGAVGLIERKSDLAKRLHRLLREGYRPVCESRALSACKILVLGSTCLFLSGMVPAKVPFTCARTLKKAVGYVDECRGKEREQNCRPGDDKICRSGPRPPHGRHGCGPMRPPPCRPAEKI